DSSSGRRPCRLGRRTCGCRHRGSRVARHQGAAMLGLPSAHPTSHMRAPTVLLATACLLAAGTVGYLLRPPQPAAPAVGQVARGALEPPDAAVTAADLGLSPAREL